MNPHRFMTVEIANNRAEYQYIHSGTPQISTAFDLKEKAELIFNIPRSLGTTEAFLEIYDESLTHKVLEIVGEWCGFEGKLDNYLFEIPTNTIGTGLYFMRPRLSVFGKEFFGHRWGRDIYFDGDSALCGLMQMTICDFAYGEPKKIRGGIIYHIFVDRFRRGGDSEVPDGARVIHGEWRCLPEYPATGLRKF